MIHDVSVLYAEIINFFCCMSYLFSQQQRQRQHHLCIHTILKSISRSPLYHFLLLTVSYNNLHTHNCFCGYPFSFYSCLLRIYTQPLSQLSHLFIYIIFSKEIGLSTFRLRHGWLVFDINQYNKIEFCHI